MPKGRCLEECNQMSATKNDVSVRYFGGEEKKHYRHKKLRFGRFGKM